MRGFNETKMLLLHLLGSGPATSAEVADHLNITHAGAASYMKKLHDQGLLRRQKLRPGSQERVYYLSAKGADRLDWLYDVDGN